MKYKTTRKAIKDGTVPHDLLAVGYCGLVTLLRNHSPIAYTCGVYGWNFDVYEVYGKTICTGYRNIPGRTPNNYMEYEAKAREILDRDIGPKFSIDAIQERDEAIEALLEEFCKQA